MGYTVAILTASDKGAAGEREDLSGPAIAELVRQAGYTVVDYALVSDDYDGLAAQLCRMCDRKKADLVLTTGGTGFSKRDNMPEATLSVVEKQVPGIPEAIRAYSMQFTPRAMLSRAAAGIRGGTLIINLPGSPKAVRESLSFILPQLPHALGILTGSDTDCAR
ncbi:MogA/MoaB family molybdenum cofactor biosynthesis protein [Ethanoligenens harbinense]|uniref:Molybdenum cofactor synthesis domain protein n=1 Tax=Ethanoligenens harbinense (strain DSM 18485 / JCM 12961 / CGMCC 1.5033 / YUAN-3) TaxID=663278 RepID=E6U3C8_ETHHY|nr:MogA/MoaB family molybdenum cofactor biosynthesis protein [Ethanoligenens harbinense]ADU26420.1 molybdenum cofactor synthesis domain protein [Ethanoligenens harbinense YUAN-3]AVQ95542.1 molybdenum cofactor biosynthesis protein [Ethanoligenens harbinense YUAN-3]AYF38206.1 molybdenum cofactor biosynthesis protein [Ethanoligenens harbinense]AYF40951.1 molybdenum cofactor biosynthesis protein [Ethanoligenens harbinense]QCN91784.1 MogA/MoaB family molybdenum cofactor biosynthesis protein [Ethano